MAANSHSIQAMPPDKAFQIVREAIYATGDSVLITDAQLEKPGPYILFVNPAFTSMTGYTAEEAIGKNPRIFQGPKTDRRLLHALREEIKAGRSASGEIINYRKDGSEFVLQWLITPVRGPDAEITHYFSIQRDISEQRRKDEELRQLNAALAKQGEELRESYLQMESFVHSVAHDLRAPLRGMRGLAEMLRTEHGQNLSPVAQDYLYRIEANSRKLGEMLNALLEYSKVGQNAIQPERVELVQAVREVEGLLARQIQETAATVNVADCLPAVAGHPQTLTLIICNLLTNAMSYAKPHVSPVINISAERRGSAVRLMVEDNGVGIPAESRGRVFQMFTRLTPSLGSGAGVGLALVKLAVERMGGKVGVDSEEGNGSRFWVELPAAMP
jgi:PAS domain S-box-containing protein